MKKYLTIKTSLVLLGSVIMLASPATALAAKPAHGGGGGSTSVVTGNDVSWPQCNKSLPKGQLFGIIGVNDGLANTTNPCFSTELAWAETSVGSTGQGKAALYVNTANPGNLGVADWPTSNTDPLTGAVDTDPYGTCTGLDNQACAYQYGHNMAELDAQTRIGSNNPASFKWWLDVETNNSWETTTANNTADLEGMTAYFESLGSSVGLYSTTTQWNQIAGTVSSTSNLYGLDSWLPGSSNLSSAKNACTLPALTGGKTTVTQYVAKRVDYDYSCI